MSLGILFKPLVQLIIAISPEKLVLPNSSSCHLKPFFPESIFASITDSDEQENSKSANLMSRVDFVYGLLKVALRNADDSLRNVCQSITCIVITNYRSWS